MQAATIIVRRSRGGLIVQATGRTGRGQSYIKSSEALSVKSMSDPKFKAELAAAINKLLGSAA